MAQLDVRRTYADTFNLLQQDLDAFVDDIETFFNLTKINDDNLQDAGITASSKLTTGSLTTAKFENNSVTTAKIADDAVTTAKIADSAVTSAKILADNITTAKIADSAVTTAKIPDDAITTVKLATSSVTEVKHAATVFSAGTSSGTKSTASTTTLCTVTVAATGRPIFVGLTSDGTSGPAYVGVPSITPAYSAVSAGYYARCSVEIKRDSTVIAMPAVQTYVQRKSQSGGVGPEYDMRNCVQFVPPGCIWTIDTPTAGFTYTYTFTLYSSTSTAAFSGHAASADVAAIGVNCTAIAWEM